MPITKEAAEALWEKVKLIHRAEEACAGPHDFEDLTPEKKLGKRYRCRLCGGEASQVDKYWYERGLAHGRRGERDGH